MIREEQRTAQIMEIASLRYEDCEKYFAFISGAMWADNNPTQDIVNLNDVWHHNGTMLPKNHKIKVRHL